MADSGAGLVVLMLLSLLGMTASLSSTWYMVDHCGETFTLDNADSQRHEFVWTGYERPPNMTCSVDVTLFHRDVIIIIERLELPSSPSCQDEHLRLQIIGESSEIVTHHCGTISRKYYLTAGIQGEAGDELNGKAGRVTVKRISLNYASRQPDMPDRARRRFKVRITALHPEPCSKAQFQCSNLGRCIVPEFECDQRNDCGNGSDEKFLLCSGLGGIRNVFLNGFLLVLLVALGVTVLGGILACVAHLVRKSRKVRQGPRSTAHEMQPGTPPGEKYATYPDTPPAYCEQDPGPSPGASVP